MSVIVQKYGGTSVATTTHIENVARRVIATKQAGHAVIVVVSAMGKETDRLDGLAREVGVNEETFREVDVLMTTGEQVSVALLAMTLINMGHKARSYTGGQVRMLTDSAHTRARLLDIETDRLRSDLKDGVIAVVAGYQGVDTEHNITTLGRGGSDTTAVALACAIGAEECQIYTDVDGVYTSDPRVCEDARCLERLTFEEMLELASQGSRVLHTRSVELASKYQMPLRVSSSFRDVPGTLISKEDESMEQAIISGVAFTRDEAKLTVTGVKDVPGIAYRILGPVSDGNIEVDMIVQNTSADQTTDFTFTVQRDDYDRVMDILQKVVDDIEAGEVQGDAKIAKISLVGVGMRSHAGVASKMFKVLSDESINIQMISTSEIKISVVVDEKYLELAVRALHSAFELNEEGA